MLELLEFDLVHNHDFVIENGLVVPKGSKVFRGLNIQFDIMDADEYAKNYKIIMGIKKKRPIEDDESIKEEKTNSTVSESDDESIVSEKIESDND